jgi:formylglycine-generating enzyme required for sulfatase activity
MLDRRLKWAFFLLTVILATLPIAGIILDITRRPPIIEVTESDGGVNRAAGPGLTSSAKSETILIPAGPFLRGYNGGGFDEKPEGRITLDAYRIDRFEVAYQDYFAFVSATGHRKPISRYVKQFEKLSGPSQPAVYVSWEDADAFCRYRGGRLPTEAEWEKAARGPEGLLWPWGNQDRPGWANTGNSDGYEFTAPVGSFTHDQSPYGAFDMDGNAMEWVSDWYQEDMYKDTHPNPQGPPAGFYKVIRGASWGTSGQETRLTIRLKMIPDFRDTTIGFRCAQTALKTADSGQGKGSEAYNKSR